MKFEKLPMPGDANKINYFRQDEDFRRVELDREDVLVQAAKLLEEDVEFPDSRGERADHLRAKRAIRRVLDGHGPQNQSSRELDQQIDRDAYEVLDLFKR